MLKSKATGAPIRRPFRLNNKALRTSWISLMQLTGTNISVTEPFAPGSWDVNPSHYSDVGSFAFHYLSSEVFSKLDDGKPSPDKEYETWRRFFMAEELCRVTNERLRKPSFGPNPFNGKSPYSAIMLARQKMEKLLGPLVLDEVALGFGWGPGASTRLSRRKGSAAHKYSGRPETTIGNVILANAAITAVPLWKEGLAFEEGSGYCNIVSGNNIITVPKSYKTHRTIAIEPDMNMYVQKGLGSVIRRRLRRVGIDLDDQTKNQRLAQIGSFAGTLATIDLSMASDTVSYEIVRLLLPPDWFEALEQCRSPVGILPPGALNKGVPETDNVLRYQKFSSMGNGYTFELETAIFCVLAWAVAELHGEKDPRISVYGDDIICPSAIANPLIETLEVAGFKPNAKKTFSEGPFRESCGSHFLYGYEVTPFYVKKQPSTLIDLFLLHNQLYRWCARLSSYMSVSEFEGVRRSLLALAPLSWRKPRLPDGFGDGAFIGTFDEATPTCAPHSLEGYMVKHLVSLTEPASVQVQTNGRILSSLAKVRNHDSFWAWMRSGCREVVSGDIPDVPRYVAVRSLIPRFAGINIFTSSGPSERPTRVELPV